MRETWTILRSSKKMSIDKQKPLIVMIFIQFIYTGMFLFSKAAISSGMKPSVFVTYRQAFATLALTPFAFFFERKGDTTLSFRVFGKIFIVSSIGIALTLNLHYVGLNYASATFATALTNTCPAMVFIIAVCLRIERLAISERHGMAKVMGAVLGISGAMAFTFYKGPPLIPSASHQTHHHISHINDSSKTAQSKEEWIKGSLLLLSSNFTWSMWLITQAPILKEYPAKLRLTALQCGSSCVVSAVYGAIVERNASSWMLGWDVHLLSVAYCGIIVTGITYWLQVWVVDKNGPVYAAIFGPITLILTAIFSALFLHETLHWGSVLGGALLVGGLYSFLWGKSREAQNLAQNKFDPSKDLEVQSDCIIQSESLDADLEKEKGAHQ